MIIGVPNEMTPTENRVALTPAGARTLVSQGHRVIVESGAGAKARFADDEYSAAGVDLAGGPEEVYGRADLIVKVAALLAPEIPLLRREQGVLAFHHLAVADHERLARLRRSGVTLIGYEMIEDARGDLPVLRPMSAIAGRMSLVVGEQLCETSVGRHGSVPGGGPPGSAASVVILGAGTVGVTAARAALARGVRVSILDTNTAALSRAEKVLGCRASVVPAHPLEVWRAIGDADILIGAVLLRGQKTPHVVSRTMVDAMKPGAAIVDVSIDQGGCVETSRPTSLDDPIYLEKRILHYAVPNMASAEPRKASLVLAFSTLPWIQELAGWGLNEALERVPGLAAGVYLRRGVPASPHLTRCIGVRPGALSGLDHVA